jgi:hypothetical protein
LYVGGSPVNACLQARVDSSGYAACQLCGTRLNTLKYTAPCPPGKKCHPRCKGQKRPAESGESSAAPAEKKQRRTKSDPGQSQQQPMPIVTTRLRIRAPKPPPQATKPRLVKPIVALVDPMALLEAAHARRMALLEAEKKRIGSSATNASAVVWQ